jgi:pimeloyl-ACP methyl ester carboxylesterase
VKRRWKVLIGVVVALGVLLAINTVVVDQQTKGAGVNVEGGQIIRLPGGDIQAKVDGPTEDLGKKAPKAPIVLLHCYACSLRWWDQLLPLLDDDRRVIRVDFLGFGGSEKPASGYSVDDQAQLVAGALNKLDVQGAVVVGQSMGSAMAVSLAQQSSQLVDRVVDMSLAVDNSASSLPFLAQLEYVPVLGEALWRLTPDFLVKKAFDDAFAPDFDVPDEFEDVIVDGYRDMTYTSYDKASSALEDFRDASPLDDRISSAAVPIMAIFGEEDQIVDTPEAVEGWSDVPGIVIKTLPGVGHTPQVEAPEKSAELILDFAEDAGTDAQAETSSRLSKSKAALKDELHEERQKSKSKSDGKKQRKH